MVLGDQNVWKAFVIAQQHVEARLELLDQVLFQKQGFGFGARRQKHHRRRFADHPGNAAGMAGRPGVGRHTRLQVAGLADIKNLSHSVEHAVDAGRAVDRLQITLNNHVACRPFCRGFLLCLQVESPFLKRTDSRFCLQ